MSKYKYVIFDIDNTLLDFSKSEYKALQKVFAKQGVVFNEETFEQYKKINGELWHQLEEGKISKEYLLEQRFYRFFLEHHIVVNGAKVDQDFRHYLEENNDLMDGAIELLEDIKGKGYTVFAGTNGIGSTQRIRLKNAQIDHFFDELFISEEVGFEKPDVRFFDYIFNQERITDKSTVIMIGDSLTSDIEGARRVGIDSIWIEDGKELPEDFASKKVRFLNEISQII